MIQNNDINENGDYGIFVDDTSHYVEIKSNNIVDNVISGIVIEGDYGYIYNNTITNDDTTTTFGIVLDSTSAHVEIDSNTIQNNGIGIKMTSNSYVSVTKNLINSNSIAGIKLYDQNSINYQNTIFSCNKISSNNIGIDIQSGVDFLTTDSNEIDMNVISGNTNYGLINRNTPLSGTNDDIDAERCYWGASTGPTGCDFTGSGDYLIDCYQQLPNNHKNVDVTPITVLKATVNTDMVLRGDTAMFI